MEISDLPPTRSHDHKIILRKGTNPINVRPYRYPTFQKSVMEGLVAEMFSEGVIRPSNRLFHHWLCW